MVGEEVKEEVKKEKVIVNVKYLGFDPSKKIGLIKEFRSIFGLGLKEAKESVETSPSILKKDVKREEAKELKEKLETAGAKIEIE
jgi:large subunit ribosomal protein L7/L12